MGRSCFHSHVHVMSVYHTGAGPSPLTTTPTLLQLTFSQILSFCIITKKKTEDEKKEDRVGGAVCVCVLCVGSPQESFTQHSDTALHS